jgi:hypothetical protein
MEFLQHIWLGKYGLAKVFWVYNVLVGFLVGVIVTPTYHFLLNSSESNFFIFLFEIVFFGFIFIYGFIVAIGVWNSATHYKGHKIWALMAKVHVVSSLIFLVLLLIGIANSVFVINSAKVTQNQTIGNLPEPTQATFFKSTNLKFYWRADGKKEYEGCFDFRLANQLDIPVDTVNKWIALSTEFSIPNFKKQGSTDEEIYNYFVSTIPNCAKVD